jgi:hypothetical protein
MRRDLGALFGAIAIAIPLCSGCFLPDCPSTFHGLHGTETLETTIVARVAGDAGAGSCGDLGDLPPGAVITSNVEFSGGEESCASVVTLEATMLSTGTVTAASTAGTSIALPNGCTGSIYLKLLPLGPGGSFLDDGDAGASPPWRLTRTFSGSCPAPLAVPSGCNDEFIATNVVVK